jgi:hypothetical protein
MTVGTRGQTALLAIGSAELYTADVELSSLAHIDAFVGGAAAIGNRTDTEVGSL